jgi:hypothetical protein
MPGAQSVKAFQKRLETGNSLSFGLADPLANILVSPIEANLGGSKSPESIPLPTFLNFQRTVYRIYKVIRSSPTDAEKRGHPENDQDNGEKFTSRSDGSDVAIPHSRHGDDNEIESVDP